uniref:Uncharacterized protein n=1 Tax=Oryza sativa subsp. japonica TaxID=39947 RepID=Q9FWM9_ORYSJ|nr:hypothetical protein [Oryza sativa Japonica Group]
MPDGKHDGGVSPDEEEEDDASEEEEMERDQIEKAQLERNIRRHRCSPPLAPLSLSLCPELAGVASICFHLRARSRVARLRPARRRRIATPPRRSSPAAPPSGRARRRAYP